MDIPPDIFKSSKRKRLEIPKTIIFGGADVPDRVVIKYKNKIDIQKLDEIVIHKLSLEGGDKLSNYNKDKESIITAIGEHNCKTDLQRFLDLCSRFITIECIKTINKSLKCKGCEKELESDEETEESKYICSVCECISTFLKPSRYYSNGDKFQTHEDDTVNFIKVIDKFEGKNEPYPPDELYSQLDSYFESLDLKKGSYYKELPFNSSGKKDGTSKMRLWDALEKTNNNKYYDESNFIAHKYWGWHLPDLSLYRDKLVSDYRETQNIWNRIKINYNRSASLGTQFRLYVHLCALDYTCDREDFKIQDMVDSLRIHNHAWKIMCKEANLKYVFVS